MGPFIVVADGMDSGAFELLQGVSGFRVHGRSQLSGEQLLPLLGEVEALVVRSATCLDSKLLGRAPKLRYVIRAGEGTDNIDKAYCRERGIRVSNTPGANNNSAAEHAIALMMSALRHVPAAHCSMREGEWLKGQFSGRELWRKRLGIVGFGRIGQLVAMRLRGFELDVLFYDPGVDCFWAGGAFGVLPQG